MELNLAFIKNSQQLLLRSFNSEGKAKVMPLAEMKSLHIDALFIPQELSDEVEIIELINQEATHYPIKLVSQETLSADNFDGLPKDQAELLFANLNQSWILNNNISLLEKIIPTASHLKALWPNDRTSFFEELWSVFKKNLGSQKLTIAYNHLRKGQKEGEKNQLIRVIVEGERSPSPVENKELGETLFNNYDKKFTSSLEVIEESDKQQVFLVTINESPVIFMSHGSHVSALQRALLKALIDAVQI